MSVAHEFQERAVDARIVAQFGMERCSHGLPLPNDHGIISFRGYDFDTRAEALDFGARMKTISTGLPSISPVRIELSR